MSEYTYRTLQKVQRLQLPIDLYPQTKHIIQSLTRWVFQTDFFDETIRLKKTDGLEAWFRTINHTSIRNINEIIKN